MEITNQFLTFVVGKEVFALDISSVREVLELVPVTRVPRTPVHMRGVINLRGNAVPVVDMRTKMGMKRAEDTVDTCIIIVEVEEGGEKTIMGAVVDGVREVFELLPEKIEEAPKMGAAVDSDYIRGMGRQGDNFLIVLDINKVFSTEELAVAQGMTEEV